MKLSSYLKLCLCLGSWSEKIPALKWWKKFTAATCAFKYLKSSIRVYLSTQKCPSLGSMKSYLFAHASLWLLQPWHALEGAATLPWSEITLPFSVIKIMDRQSENTDIILPWLQVIETTITKLWEHPHSSECLGACVINSEVHQQCWTARGSSLLCRTGCMELLTHKGRASNKPGCLSLSIKKEHRVFSGTWALEGEATPLEGVRSCLLWLQISCKLRCFYKKMKWQLFCAMRSTHILSRWSRCLHWFKPASRF